MSKKIWITWLSSSFLFAFYFQKIHFVPYEVKHPLFTKKDKILLYIIDWLFLTAHETQDQYLRWWEFSSLNTLQYKLYKYRASLRDEDPNFQMKVFFAFNWKSKSWSLEEERKAPNPSSRVTFLQLSCDLLVVVGSLCFYQVQNQHRDFRALCASIIGRLALSRTIKTTDAKRATWTSALRTAEVLLITSTHTDAVICGKGAHGPSNGCINKHTFQKLDFTALWILFWLLLGNNVII